jgi:hypothetical protein
MSHGSETRKMRGGKIGSGGRRSRNRQWDKEQEAHDNASISNPYVMPLTTPIQKKDPERFKSASPTARRKLIEETEEKGLLRTDYTSLINRKG